MDWHPGLGGYKSKLLQQRNCSEFGINFFKMPPPIVRKPILPLASKQDRLEARNIHHYFSYGFSNGFFEALMTGIKGIFKLEIFLVDAEWILRGRWWQLAYMIALQ